MHKAPAPPCSTAPVAVSDWRAVTFIGAVAIGLFTIRLCAPPNLLDQDQENPATYVLDAVKNGNWICQRDLLGNITSKPPLYTWLAALTSVACGQVNLFALYLPGALALFGSAALVYRFGRQHFGPRAGLFSAFACMLCTAGLKQFGLARTDSVFAFTVTLTAFLAYRAWIRGGGWTWFWLAAAAATLTKGPLGLVLAGGGLLGSFWERRSGDPLPIRGSHLLGVSLFVAITVGWLGLAYCQLGRAVIDKLFLQELVFHVVEGEQKKIPGSLFYLSPLYYLGRAAPWSLLAYYGLWRIWRTPAQNVAERRFERFLFCWFLGGLVLFSLAPHQRGDLLWPIMPAGALIAGRELARIGSGRCMPPSEDPAGEDPSPCPLPKERVLLRTGLDLRSRPSHLAPLQNCLKSERGHLEQVGAEGKPSPQGEGRVRGFGSSWLFRAASIDRFMIVVVVAAMAGFGLYYFGPRARHPLIQQTIALKALAQEIERLSSRDFPLTHTDDPAGLQVYLNTYRPPVSFERAAALLRGPEAAFVAVTDWTTFQSLRKPGDPVLHTILEDHGVGPKLKTRIVSNRPRLAANEPTALAFGPWSIRYRGRLVRADGDQVALEGTAGGGQLNLVNEGNEPRKMNFKLIGSGAMTRTSRLLRPGERVTLTVEPNR